MLVQTVDGAIDAQDLGRTQMHEHLLLDIYPTRWSFEHILDDVDVAIAEMVDFRAAGGGCLVEVTPRGAGRNPAGLRRISRASGVHIVMGTSLLWGTPEIDTLLETHCADALADLMVRDLLEGADDSDIRAGLIGEVGCGSTRQSAGVNQISPAEERLLRAAARAQKQTGALIYTDTFHGELALEQLELLSEEGVDLSRVVIGHLGDKREPDLFRQIVCRGANLGFDHVGMFNCAPDTWRVESLCRLIDEGALGHLVLSMDVHRRSYWRCMGGCGYDYLLTEFVQLLRQHGVEQADIDTMLIANPAKLLPFRL